MDSRDPNLKYWIPQPISAQAYVLPVFATLAIVLLIIPFYYHLSLRSIGPSSLILFISLANLFTVTNALLWPTDDFANWYDGNILCDIQAKIRWPLVTGVNCATMCITRNLALMFNTEKQIVAPTRGMRRRKMWTDLGICFGIPTLQIGLHYIIQINRFYVVVIGGCAPSFDNSWPTIVIMYIWPILFCFGNCYYAALVIIRLRRHRSTALSSLAAHSLPFPLFIRLLLMSLLLLIIYLPLCIFFFYVNLDISWLPYDWALVHNPDFFTHIIYLPPLGSRTFDNWVPIVDAFAIILFLGLAGDALDLYRRILLRVPYMGRWFPSLKLPRTARGNRSHVGDSGAGLLSKLSITSRARAYFDSRKGGTAQASDASHLHSQENDFELSTSSATDSRKGSAVPALNHVSNCPATPNHGHASHPGVAVPMGNFCSNCKGNGVGDDFVLPTAPATAKPHPHPSTQFPDSGIAPAGGLETSVGVGTPRRVQSRDGQEGVRVEKRVEVRDEYQDCFGDV